MFARWPGGSEFKKSHAVWIAHALWHLALHAPAAGRRCRGVPYLCRAFNQDQVVMDFLRQPAKSQRGLPARPVVGCAVSIRLDLPPAVIEEWFGQ